MGVGSPKNSIETWRRPPGFVEGFIPVWGSGRASLNYYQEGRWVWGTVHLGLAVTDVFLVKSLVTAGGKLVFGGTTRAVAAVGGRTLEGAEVRAAESLATQRALRTRALDEAGNLAHSAPSALGGRAQRAAQYGSNWQAASLEKAIARHAGENYTTWVTESGKRVFENSATGRQVVCDIEGGYFRIFQPKTIGSSQGTYLNLMGREVTPAMRVKGGAIKSVPLRDVDKGMWQAETHFWAE